MATKPRTARRPKTLKRKRPARKAAMRRVTKKRVVASAVSKRRVRKKLATRRADAQPSLVEAALAAFAHEVRTPLTGILAISSLLATSDLGERERRWVDTIKTGAEHLSALASLYVDAAKRNSGLYVREELFDLRALAFAAGDSLAGRATANGLQSQITVAGDLPAFVSGDVVQLRAALENLIDNAVKFTPTGSVGLDVSAAAASRGKIKVAFVVSDSGIGLSLPEARRLFRPFSQANIDVASRFGGAGLGLWSVKQLASAMGGGVRVASRPGGGTVFTLTVSLVVQPHVAGNATASGAPYPEGLRILSVEDNPFGRVVLNAVLGELGHKIEFVGQGELATERIPDGGFDVVLMDMVLPGIDGVETIRRIRDLPSPYNTIGIIGVSGREQDEVRARAAGADAFLIKPVSPRALTSALHEAFVRAAA
ncbi:MAG: response regulator [Xanthobacteraceae bacterium]|nr:response regulator [Xanthobacteraceae bacterium]